MREQGKAERKRTERQGQELGIRPQDLLKAWLGKLVTLELMDGREIQGVLIGVSTYDIALQLPEGRPLYVFKHGVVTIREAGS